MIVAINPLTGTELLRWLIRARNLCAAFGHAAVMLRQGRVFFYDFRPGRRIQWRDIPRA